MNILDANKLQPAILVGIINERLRHDGHNLADLAAELELNSLELEQRLADAGFHYQSSNQQFVRK
ncbi:DUF4250 family protein [Ferrimonas senticii]|uniref:DUF4250 family protein n=1 Tax=Ferrimonas senticii TaxID=394566 RepID=UPI0004061E9B|nr:DUF4250 family protein [Ferrimonas senticii]